MAVSVSDVKLKSAKPEAKPYRIPIGENVYVDVLPNGRKISVGRYHLSLEHRALAAKLLNNGG